MHDFIGPDPSKDGGSIGDAMTTDNPEGGRPGAPDVAVEACVLVPGYVGGPLYWSVHLYPGKTVLDLAHVTAVVQSSTDSTPRPGFRAYATPCSLRDGAAASSCAGPTDMVTFILP